jgi:hypothetical protein
MRHFGGGIGHSSRVLPGDCESSSDSDSSMGSEYDLHSAHAGEEEGIEANSEPDDISVSSSSSAASHDDPLGESDLDSDDDGYDSL